MGDKNHQTYLQNSKSYDSSVPKIRIYGRANTFVNLDLYRLQKTRDSYLVNSK